jgi:hypothetical protein
MKVAYDLKVNWDDVPHFPDDEHNYLVYVHIL